ncbi:MAG: Rne/Rng family ribonuclease [Bacteroidota bacterium]
MNNQLFIDSTPKEVVIALLEDNQLVELNRDKSNNKFAVGDLYLGVVKKISSGLNAAFVDIGYKKDAFLHYLDLGPHYYSFSKFTKHALSNKQSSSLLDNFHIEKELDKGGKISSTLSSNQHVLVQITKEPISTKGARISSEISLAGRYLVLIPFSDKVSISQKISNIEERNRLKRLMQSIKPKNFGIIIRTVAENKKVAVLDKDLKDLISKWDSCYEKLKTSRPPQKVLGELDRTSTMLRDILNSTFNSIYVNNVTLYEEVKKYIHTIAPDKEKIVKSYNGKTPIFEHFGIDKQIKALFGKYVNLKSGAYLVIEHTEALHVIDVNSGRSINSKENQEANALAVNLEAATEIALQLKLRDMGGIIVIDFIDMYLAENRKALYEKFKNAMHLDRAKNKILPPSKFGLIQLTRQRVRPEMNIITVEKCPACDGSGEIQSSVLFIDKIENNIKYIFQVQNEPSLTLCVHPFIWAYLSKGLMSVQRKWFLKFRRRIKVRAVSSYHFLEYRFFNKNDEEIKM